MPKIGGKLTSVGGQEFGLDVQATMIGQKELDRNLKMMTSAARRSVVRSSLRKGLRLTVKAMRRLAPRGRFLRLFKSIRTISQKTEGRELVRLGVGPTQRRHVARFLETGFDHVGGKRISGRPWMRPAWDSTKEQVFLVFAQDLGGSMLRFMKRIERKIKTGKVTAGTRRFLKL